MTPNVTWNGTQQESFDLVSAVAHNCACEFGLMGVRVATCTAHQMLVEDQRALNGLIFARRIAKRLQSEEWEQVGDASTISMRDFRAAVSSAA